MFGKHKWFKFMIVLANDKERNPNLIQIQMHNFRTKRARNYNYEIGIPNQIETKLN